MGSYLCRTLTDTNTRDAPKMANSSKVGDTWKLRDCLGSFQTSTNLLGNIEDAT